MEENKNDNLPNITDENEKEYWDKFKKNSSPNIREAFFLKYKHLVEYAADRIYTREKNRRDIQFKDLIDLGFSELLEAIDRYDINEDINFNDYALMRIMFAIIDKIEKINTLPKDIQNLISIILNENKDR